MPEDAEKLATLPMGMWNGTATRTQSGSFFENLSMQLPFNPATAFIPEKWKPEALGRREASVAIEWGSSVFDYTKVNRAVMSRCDFARRYHRGKLSQGYTGSVCVLSYNRMWSGLGGKASPRVDFEGPFRYLSVGRQAGSGCELPGRGPLEGHG